MPRVPKDHLQRPQPSALSRLGRRKFTSMKGRHVTARGRRSIKTTHPSQHASTHILGVPFLRGACLLQGAHSTMATNSRRGELPKATTSPYGLISTSGARPQEGRRRWQTGQEESKQPIQCDEHHNSPKGSPAKGSAACICSGGEESYATRERRQGKADQREGTHEGAEDAESSGKCFIREA